MSHPWGASPRDWAHLDLICGLTADLLPVVSNPGAKIAAGSKMKALGKTPSRYNQAGEVGGIKDWTDQRTTGRQIEKWSQQSDYGICIQTREVRALDIDIPDPELAARVAGRFLDLVGRSHLPTRGRGDSGKRLLAFRLPGDFRKRSFRVEGGLVEFLATGQQFVAVGTHPNGARYEWAGGLPADFPEISAEDFERAWAALVAEFAVEPERRARERVGTGDGNVVAADPVADWLEANWKTYGSDGEKLFALCPFKEGHSGDSGETEAAWLLAGTSGYERGHFACLHASCSGRTDAEFFKAVGMPQADKADFTPVKPQALALADPAAAYVAAAQGLAGPPDKASTGVKRTAAHPTGVEALPLPGFVRNKQGGVLATLGNVVAALQASRMTGHTLRYDTFRGELVIVEEGSGDWRPFRDADAVTLRIALASHPQWGESEQIGKELMRDALTKVAADNAFDSAVHWLTNVVPKWDGVKRIERLFPDYFGTDDNPYTRACGLYVMTAHAGRIIEPGCQADMAPILLGAQGLRKSSGVAAISPDPVFFKKFDLLAKDADQSRKMRGVLVGEFDEMRGLNGRGAEEVRSFMTKRWEDWTPKYQEYETKFARRLLFWGTGNEDEILNDPTGERRWLPMRVRRMVDVDRIVADQLQLWAEALVMFTALGVMWEDAERLAKSEHADFKVTDAWEDDVAKWLADTDVGGKTPMQRGPVRTAHVLVGALGFEPARITKADEMRMGRVLVSMGLEKVVTRVVTGGVSKTTKVWVRA